MTTFAIATLGCKVNTYESQHYLEAMREAGFREVSFREPADVYIINTCSVTNTAASKSRQRIHQARKQNPAAIVAVVGCYAQSASPSALAALQVDIIIGAKGKQALVEQVQSALKGERVQKPVLEDARRITAFEPLHIHAFSHQTRAFLKVQDGCNQFCSYCIIPYARGSERSIDPMQAVALAQEMAANHHQEIVLSGIHTGRYGREQGSSLLQLLELLIDNTPAHVRYRISSIEMNEIDDDFIAYMQKEPRIARHLHIPIQAADDALLKAMNRPYDVAWFIKRMEAIRTALPHVSISTDMIVGFPGESEEQFVQALERVEKELRFSFIHCFPYSKRDHTAAALMSDQIPNTVKKARVKALSALSQQLYHSYMASFINESVDVVVETIKEGMYFGHSSEYLPIYIPQRKQTEMPARLRVQVKGYAYDGLKAIETEEAS